MLPGFRFLFAAIVLSMSLLVFGLGAAALLRSAHEEFASNPTWRAAPEVKFAQVNEATMPVLATLRLEMDDKSHENGPAPAASAETAATASPPAAPEQIVASKLEEAVQPEAVSQEIATSNPVKSDRAAEEISPAMNGAAPASAPTASAEKAAVAEEAGEQPKIAANPPGEPPPGDDPPAAAPQEQAAAQVTPEAELALTKIATLGGPAVDITPPPKAKTNEAKTNEAKTGEAKSGEATTNEAKTGDTKSNEAKPDPAQSDQNAAAKKRVEEKRAARQRRIAAARARLAAQQAQQQLQVGPFLAPPVQAARTH